MIRALALDLSLAATGLARTHTSTGEPRLSTTTIVTHRSPAKARPNLMDHVRAQHIIGEVVKACKMRPQLVAIESPLLVDVGDASVRLAEVHGAIKHWLFSREIPYVDVHLTHVKMFATGDGGASKDDVLRAMTERYSPKPLNVHIGDHNAADALSLLAMTLHAYGEPLADVPESHRRALDSYAWPTAPGGA